MAITLTPAAPTIDSRAAVGLRSPRSVSTNIRAAAGGLAVHHGGDAQGIPASDSHARCRLRVRGWQDFHMGSAPVGRGWVDLAYNWVVCQHGVLMVGRGFGVRSAANGSNDGNDRYLACCWLGGGDEQPTVAAKTAIEWLVGEIRRRGAGTDVQPHRHFFPTTCPGDALAKMADVWRGATILEPGAKPSARPGKASAPAFPLSRGQYFGPRAGGPNSVSGFYSHRSDLARWQAKVGGLTADGLYGPATAARARALQAAKKAAVDGLIGPVTWKAAWS